MSFNYLKQYRDMPWIKLHMAIEVDGKRGVVTGENSNGNVNVRFDGEPKHVRHNCHPKWQTVYYDESGNIVADYRKPQPEPEKQPCPFCPLQGIEESEYLPVEYDYFGEPATIGGIPSCAACASVAKATDTTELILAELEEARKAQVSA